MFMLQSNKRGNIQKHLWIPTPPIPPVAQQSTNKTGTDSWKLPPIGNTINFDPMRPVLQSYDLVFDPM